MDPEFWHKRWEQNEIGFHQAEINVHLQTHWPQLKVASGARVFVPLCGKSSDLLWLLGEGYEVVGVEISPRAVNDFFAENRIPFEKGREGAFDVYRSEGLTVLCGDFFDLEPRHLDGIVAIYDRASLVALPPSMRERYAAQLKRLFPTGLNALLVTMEYPQEEMSGPPFSVSGAEVEQLYGDVCRIEPLQRLDLLAENPAFRERGLSRMEEQVYRLSGRS